MILLALAIAVASPAKLVIVYGEQPPTVVNYASLARCETAKRKLLDQASKEETVGATIERGGIYRIRAYCIPG